MTALQIIKAKKVISYVVEHKAQKPLNDEIARMWIDQRSQAELQKVRKGQR